MLDNCNFKHEPKACPRCRIVFECKVGNVEQCHCSKIKLNEYTQKYIQKTFEDCLCADCLREVRTEFYKKSFYDRIRRLFGG